MSDFWKLAGRLKRWEREAPERLQAHRGELGLATTTPCPLYGPHGSYQHAAHALYVRWTTGEIDSKKFGKALRRLTRKKKLEFNLGAGI